MIVKKGYLSMVNKFSSMIAQFLEKQIKLILDKHLLPKIEDILFSQKFARYIQQQTKQAIQEMDASDKLAASSGSFPKEGIGVSFRMIAEEFLYQEAEVVTNSGVLKGVIIEVREDYMRLQETPTVSVVLPFASISSIREP
jgi:hypothetical protein